jgi:hypothetical protein
MTDFEVDVHPNHPFPMFCTSIGSVSPIQRWNKENRTGFGTPTTYVHRFGHCGAVNVQEEKTLRSIGRRDRYR